MSGRSPLHGYNTNYRREGLLYHVQTEDLGERIAAIVTQVFTGGTILAKKRTVYRDLIGEEALVPQLQRMMQRQHKEVLLGLRDGTLELAVDPRNLDQAEAGDWRREVRDTVQMELPPEFLEELERELLIGAGDGDSALDGDEPILETVPLDPRESEIPLVDIDSLAPSPPPIRITGMEALGPGLAHAVPPPVPPASNLAPELPASRPTPHHDPTSAQHPSSGAAQLRESQVSAQLRESQVNAPLPMRKAESRPPPLPPDAGCVARGVDGDEPKPEADRSSRSSRIFSEVSRPAPGFGEELLGERSLDEVILSYLAEELQEDS